MTKILSAGGELLLMWQRMCSDPQLLERLSQQGDTLQRELVRLRTEPSESISVYSNQQYLARSNWIRANERVTQWIGQRESPSIAKIKLINKMLGEGLAPWNRAKQAASVGAKFGEYRTVDTVSGIPPRYYLRCDQVGVAMTDLIDWYETAVQRKTMPILVAAQMYQRLVSVHPFPDANGRTARLVMDWILQLNGLPPVLINNDNLALFPNGKNDIDSGCVELQVIDGLRKSLELHVEVLRLDE
jgi:Fic family protein